MMPMPDVSQQPKPVPERDVTREKTCHQPDQSPDQDRVEVEGER